MKNEIKYFTGVFENLHWSLTAFSSSISGVGRVEARGQAASDRGEPTEEEEGGDGADAADEAGAEHGGVGADPDGDRSPPAHQCPGLQLETEAQVPGKLSQRRTDIFSYFCCEVWCFNMEAYGDWLVL